MRKQTLMRKQTTAGNSVWKPFAVALLAIIIVCSCSRQPAFLRYKAIDDGQWERGAAQQFATTIPADGDYDITLLLRLERTFPFLNLNLIADETVFPSLDHCSTPVTIDLSGSRGTIVDDGISLLQYAAPVATQHFSRGDSLQISVRHDMRCGILPGVVDVGVCLEKH